MYGNDEHDRQEINESVLKWLALKLSVHRSGNSLLGSSPPAAPPSSSRWFGISHRIIAPHQAPILPLHFGGNQSVERRRRRSLV